mmetsp:Transcript_14648/g.37619  ORF Transcript_14648/g.37619 Transcript_14648/m.37619 type:complete len:455 (-) Transcript_14648:883-2247(-)
MAGSGGYVATGSFRETGVYVLFGGRRLAAVSSGRVTDPRTCCLFSGRAPSASRQTDWLRLQTVEHEVALALARLAGRQELGGAQRGHLGVVVPDPAATGAQHVGDEVALVGLLALVADGGAKLVLVGQQVNHLAPSALHARLARGRLGGGGPVLPRCQLVVHDDDGHARWLHDLGDSQRRRHLQAGRQGLSERRVLISHGRGISWGSHHAGEEGLLQVGLLLAALCLLFLLHVAQPHGALQICCLLACERGTGHEVPARADALHALAHAGKVGHRARSEPQHAVPAKLAAAVHVLLVGVPAGEHLRDCVGPRRARHRQPGAAAAPLGQAQLLLVLHARVHLAQVQAAILPLGPLEALEVEGQVLRQARHLVRERVRGACGAAVLAALADLLVLHVGTQQGGDVKALAGAAVRRQLQAEVGEALHDPRLVVALLAAQDLVHAELKVARHGVGSFG